MQISAKSLKTQIAVRAKKKMEEKLSHIENQQLDDDEEEDEGPPPGFDSLAVPSQNTNVVIDEDDDEGPPPGWPSIPQQHNLQVRLIIKH